MSLSVTVCPSTEWVFSSSSAVRLQLTQCKSLQVLGRKKNTAHLLEITASALSLAIAVSRLEVHTEVSLDFPPQTQPSTLCAWQMTYALNLARKAEISSPVYQTLAHICCHAFVEHTDRWDCLTLHGKLAQGETRPHYINILHALMSPTFSVPLLKSTSLWRHNFLSSIFLF